VIGARSALFLPFPRLGLIVVDEEHDPAYKQEEGVTYNARDMAVVRAHLSGFPIVLASATPSVESRVNADRGRYAHVLLPARFGAGAPPTIAALDLRLDPPERGRWLAPPLVAAIEDTLGAGEQALLFLNRRGYAPLTLCRTCGHRMNCPNCSSWLVEHRFRRTLACHHCGHEERRPELCPKCSAEDSLVACGPGVERLHEEVLDRYPRAKSLVLSSDMPGGVGRLRGELEAFAKGTSTSLSAPSLSPRGTISPACRSSAWSTPISGWRMATRGLPSARSSSSPR
jgi:primosomal protein N' (replication factor Y)